MTPTAVMPVKSFHMSKERLGGAISDNLRSSLGAGLANHTLGVARSAGFTPLVVAGDEAVAIWAEKAGALVVPDPGTGLDGAAGAGVAAARERADHWIVIHSDLPLLRHGDLQIVRESLVSHGSVISPSADGGTSAVGGTVPITFSYGPGSFFRHLARLFEPVVVSRLGLLNDLDSPNDLEAIRMHFLGKWVDELLLAADGAT